ncbi:MAG: hypothetical protein QOI71_3882 [Gaiellales bacterium]|jgi:hypothetical protein|nr:hypothetical protein [Gaiellales bacterium]
MGVSELSVRLAREDWRSGEQFVERILADPARAPIARAVMQELERELRRRLGQTYTIAMLVALYGDADRWARDAAQRSAPEVGWAHDAAFADAACARAARNARDWKPTT